MYSVFDGLFAFKNIDKSLSEVSLTDKVGYFNLQDVISRRPLVTIAPTDCSRNGTESSNSENDSNVIFSVIGGNFTGRLTVANLFGFDINLMSLCGFSNMNFPSIQFG